MPLPSPRRALAALGLAAVAASLAGCEQVQVIRSSPVSASFDSRSGNTVLTAFDAGLLQDSLRQSGVWTVRIDATPTSAGDVDTRKSQAVIAGRGRFTAITVTMTASAQGTIEGFAAHGSQQEELYCQEVVQALAQAGYTHLRDIHVEVYYNGSHHSTLSWTAATGFVFKVLDGRP
jgi:hypothetical protein